MSQENTHRQQESLNRFNSEFVSNLNSLKDKKRKISIKISKEKKGQMPQSLFPMVSA